MMCTKHLAAYFCLSMLYHQEPRTQVHCPVTSAVFPQALLLLSSSTTYLDACPIVRFYFLLCSRLLKAVSFCKATCILHKAYQSGERVHWAGRPD